MSKIMNYRIQELDEFFVVGQDIELTTSQRRNLQISTSFWRQFNINLKTLHCHNLDIGSNTHSWKDDKGNYTIFVQFLKLHISPLDLYQSI